MRVSFVIKLKKKQKLILWSVEQRRGSVFESKRMISPCSCFSFGEVYIIFALLSISALIHIFLVSDSCLNGWGSHYFYARMLSATSTLEEKKHVFLLLLASLRKKFTVFYILLPFLSCLFFMSLMVKKNVFAFFPHPLLIPLFSHSILI